MYYLTGRVSLSLLPSTPLTESLSTFIWLFFLWDIESRWTIHLFEGEPHGVLEVYGRVICKYITQGQSSEYLVTCSQVKQWTKQEQETVFWIVQELENIFCFSVKVRRILLLGVVGRSAGFLFIRPQDEGFYPLFFSLHLQYIHFNSQHDVQEQITR